MRSVPSDILSLSLFLCAAAHLQGQTGKPCRAPAPYNNLTQEEQDANRQGYLAACRSAKAEDAHPLHEDAAPPPEENSISPNDAVSHDVSVSGFTEDDYFSMIKQKGCKTLLAAATAGVENFDSHDGRIAYLSTIVNGMQGWKRCN